MEKRKPRLGILGLITDGYESVFPGILKRQEDYAKEIVTALSKVADVEFPGAATNRKQIEAIMSSFNTGADEKKVDGVLIILLAYSQGAWITRALLDNRLPIALAVVQPDQQVGSDWDELRLTVNQGIHGAQDNANVINRLGIPCSFFVGNRHEEEFIDFAENFGKAARAHQKLKNMRVGIIGKMPGMGDILYNEMEFFKSIGPEVIHDTIGSVCQWMETVTEDEMKAQILSDQQRFDVDSKLSEDSHRTAIVEYLGFKKYVENKNLDAYTVHFDIFADDGRFKQLPLYAASELLSQGIGYAAEGDVICAAMVSAGGCLGDQKANFTEMYTIDFSMDAIIFCHAGEGNFATARKDVPVKLIDRYLGEGGLDNPPTHIFTPEPGEYTLYSLVSQSDGKFRIIAAKGDILSRNDMVNCEMPYFFWKPQSGVKNCIEGWLKNGGPHHEIIQKGDITKSLQMLCDMLGIGYTEV